MLNVDKNSILNDKNMYTLCEINVLKKKMLIFYKDRHTNGYCARGGISIRVSDKTAIF